MMMLYGPHFESFKYLFIYIMKTPSLETNFGTRLLLVFLGKTDFPKRVCVCVCVISAGM